MSAGNPERFPWGLNVPTQRQRIAVAFAIGICATLILLQRFIFHPGDKVDFDLMWFGAHSLLNGQDPYPLVGPGKQFQWDFSLLYPMPSLVAVMPLAVFSMRNAALASVFFSSTLLAFGATRDGWHTLPMFASAAFIDTTVGAQWSSLLVAGLFLPWLGVVILAKPQLGLAVVAGNASKRIFLPTVIGTLVLVAVSFALVPSWLKEWILLAKTADHMKAVVFQPGGFLILLVMMRWRRPEAWLVLLTALLPQTLMWYSFLVLLAFPRTYREACVLSLVSSVGCLIARGLAEKLPPVESTGKLIWGIVVVTTFIPAVIAILRRPNEGRMPWWMSLFSDHARRIRTSL